MHTEKELSLLSDEQKSTLSGVGNIPYHSWYKNAVHIVIWKALPYFMIYMIFAVYMFVCVTDMFTLPQLGVYQTFVAFVIPYLLACIFLAMILSFFLSIDVKTQFCY